MDDLNLSPYIRRSTYRRSCLNCRQVSTKDFSSHDPNHSHSAVGVFLNQHWISQMARVPALHHLAKLDFHVEIHRLREVPDRDLGAGVSDPKCSPPHHQQLLYRGIVENPRSAPRFLGGSPRRCRQPRDSNTLEETWILHLLYYQSWYALSWGSCFYIAVMLVDLDVTYKRRIYLYARPFKYYPLLTSCIVLSLVGLSTDLLTQLTGINYPTFEYAIHPSISQAGLAQYPAYYIPRLNGLAFGTGLQATLELSPVLQKFFSLRPLKLLFPHTFTVYLIHGFVFWSLGSWLCVTLAVHGLSYWANILTVAVFCYAAIALSLPLLTPLVETLGGGGGVSRLVWQHAHEEPESRRPTLFPFE